jgi:hypothetical protein
VFVFRVPGSIASGRRQSPDHHLHSGANRQSHGRLFLLAAAFLARGLTPEDACNKALYYIKGPGRCRNWMSALAEHDREMDVDGAGQHRPHES